MKYTVTNNSDTSPIGVHTATGRFIVIERGASLTAEFADTQVASMETNDELSIEPADADVPDAMVRPAPKKGRRK